MIDKCENNEVKHCVNNEANALTTKHNWEIKKLGEVCEIERGGSPRPIQAYITEAEDGINWIKIGDAIEGSKYIVSTKEKIKPEGMKKSRFVHKGDFILSNSMSFGRPYILAVDGCIHDGWLVIRDKGNRFDKSYLYYYLGSPNTYNEFKRLAVGGVVNNLNSELVRSVTIPIPPLAEQGKIVEELDCLNGIIEKKKEQLKELDLLAQSIFYTMFGDPISNEKGWKVKPLKEVAPQQEYKGEVPCFNGKYWLLNLDMISPNTGEIIKKCYYDDDEIGNSTIKFNGDNVLYSKLRPYLNKVVIPNDIGYATSELVPLCPQKDVLDKIFCASLLKSPNFVKYISSKVAGAKMPRVSMGIFREFAIILHPLSLQQEFATKIEAIEKQKGLIKESIKETETLFNARMQYYFG